MRRTEQNMVLVLKIVLHFFYAFVNILELNHVVFFIE